MDNNSFIVCDENGNSFIANVLTMLEIDGYDYVICNIQNDLNSSGVYALRMLVNDDGKNKLVSISDSIEKRKVFSIVDKMIRSR